MWFTTPCCWHLFAKGPKPNDWYVSSCIPSLSTVIKARSGFVTRTNNPNLLVIAQPDEILPKVKEEIDLIQRLLKHNADIRILEGRIMIVLLGLRTHSWVYFTCHGHLNDQPSHSSSQLHDKRPPGTGQVDTIISRCGIGISLSACHTAAGDVVSTPG